MGTIKYIFFDAANTLINKPLLWERITGVLTNHGYIIPLPVLKQKHKLLSESMRFPDRTSGDFYKKFNSELLLSLGIVPEEKITEELFTACTYLPWEKFSDTAVLTSLQDYSLGIISNFNTGLSKMIEKEFGPIFKHILASETQGLSKPDLKFYELALSRAGADAGEVLYIGDSIKLDVEPALALGMNALLIDRDEIYPDYPKRIVSLEQLTHYL